MIYNYLELINAFELSQDNRERRLKEPLHMLDNLISRPSIRMCITWEPPIKKKK